VPCPVTITSTRPKNDQARPTSTRATIVYTRACRARQGSAVRNGDPFGAVTAQSVGQRDQAI